MARIKTIVNMPAAEIAAVVNSPEIAEATDREARIRVTTSMSTAPRGVLINSTILDVPLFTDIPPDYIGRPAGPF